MLDPFAHPERLWLLAALVPLSAWVARGSRLRRRDWAALGQSSRPGGDDSRAWLVAIGLIVVALAQPRWGRVAGSEPPAGRDVVLLVDVSRSMAAEDAVPDRLGLAVEESASLLRALRPEAGDRAAVVGFAGRATVRCPLTSDLDAALDVLRSLRPGEIQPGGTDLGAALDSAIGAFDEEEHADGRTIVVFSDGEDHVGSWRLAIDRLRGAGIIVHSVAIGDPDRGHPVPPRSARDRPAETRRSDVAFEAISKATGGAVIPLGLAPADLGALFRDRIEPTARRLRAELRAPERVERFPAFLLAALGFGLAGSWPGLARRRGGRLALSAALVASIALGAGPPATTPAGLIARGRTDYGSGRFAEALGAFERAIALDPAAAIPRYDAASALFQLHRYREAIARYEEAAEHADPGLAIKIDYALGNARLALGEISEAIARYDACLASDLPGAEFDAIRADAEVNRAFAASRSQPPPEESGGPGSKPPGPKPPGPTSKGDPGESEPSPSDASPGEGPQDAEPSTTGSRGAGGAGGSGQAPPPVGSPEARLDEALREIREARGRRPPEPPPSGSKGSGKDW